MKCLLSFWLLAVLFLALSRAQWEENERRRVLKRTLALHAHEVVERISNNTDLYDEWIVDAVKRIKISDGFEAIYAPDNILELWSVMSSREGLAIRINEFTPHDVTMPEEEKLMCAIVSRLIWEKLQKDQFDHEAPTNSSLTLTFTLTYEEFLPSYLAMSDFLSKADLNLKALNLRKSTPQLTHV